MDLIVNHNEDLSTIDDTSPREAIICNIVEKQKNIKKWLEAGQYDINDTILDMLNEANITYNEKKVNNLIYEYVKDQVKKHKFGYSSVNKHIDEIYEYLKDKDLN